MSFLESPIVVEACNLWSCFLSDATQKREGEHWVSEKRELWVKENKNEEGEETEKNRLEREMLLDGTSHTGGLHEVKNSTQIEFEQ